MPAREALLETLAVLSDCLRDPAVVDRAPTDVAHNNRASMLRQGLAVLTFATVETFIRDRIGEVLKSFDATTLRFQDLSEKLQSAVTLGALEGVRFRLKLLKPPDPVAWLVGSLKPIASVSTTVHPLSEMSFGASASNLVEDDIKEILKAFGVSDPWTQMTSMTSRVGVALLDCKTEFETMKKRRHSAAHALTSKVLHTDLASSLRAAKAICIVFDLLLSESLGLHNKNRVPGVNANPQLTQGSLKLVFVEPLPGRSTFRVRREQRPPPSPILPRPTVRVFPAAASALAFARPYAETRQAHVVVLDAGSTPTAWHPW